MTAYHPTTGIGDPLIVIKEDLHTKHHSSPQDIGSTTGNIYGETSLFSETKVPFYVSQSDHSETTHWSVAWSDLMMTMFVLFLSLFVYQAANQEFLEPTTPEVIGGDTTEALQIGNDQFPFQPLGGRLAPITSGTVKKVETVPLPDKSRQTSVEIARSSPERMRPSSQEYPETNPLISAPETIGILIPNKSEPSVQLNVDHIPPPSGQSSLPEPRPLIAQPQATQTDELMRMYNLSQKTLGSGNLGDLAKIDLAPDKTMRIILTSDLLFALGDAQLSPQARTSLLNLGQSIRETPYMINVVGHTDNVPMRSGRYKSNWELSLARASAVAQFLINSVGMNPGQFVVSGYASYRPLLPNTTAKNRARNRRVEIIISKRLPSPKPFSPTSLR